MKTEKRLNIEEKVIKQNRKDFNYRSRQRGSVTIEAIIIFSSMFLIIILLSYSAIILFEQVRLNNLAQDFNLKIAKAIDNNENKIISDNEIKDYEKNIERIAKDKSLLKIEKCEVEISIENKFFDSYIGVEFNSKYQLPVTKVLKYFWNEGLLTLDAKSESRNVSNEEIIRTIEFLSHGGIL